MLKIKNNVDLKELEKFGFKDFSRSLGHYDYNYPNEYPELRISTKDRSIYAYDTRYDGKNYLNVLYDLIQAGLVEKVEG